MSVVAPSPIAPSARRKRPEVARLLHPSGSGRPAPLDPEALDALAIRLAMAIGPEDLAVDDGGDGDGSGHHARRHRQLVLTPAYDAWLIAWGASSVLELHDHGGSIGAVRVVNGELIEMYSDVVRPHPLRSRTVGRGSGFSVPATRAHEVWNPGPCEALSVHVYSPPLAAMTFFDHHPDRFLLPLRTEYGDVASLDGGAQ
jgi:hypothetical protein